MPLLLRTPIFVSSAAVSSVAVTRCARSPWTRLAGHQFQLQQKPRRGGAIVLPSAWASFLSTSTTNAPSNSTTPPSSSRHYKLRRTRKYAGHCKVTGNHKPFLVDPSSAPRNNNAVVADGDTISSTTPFDHGLDSIEEYLNKTTLSPWVPIPEVVARRALDLAGVSSTVVHVDLGSGDGRVCFLALDAYGAAHSVGVDVDDAIVQVAQARKAKRHPAPTNLHFVVGDLLDPFDSVWDVVLDANPTVITMYFASPALSQFRPVLEEKLLGRSCRIVTFGYEMPGWEPSTFEVVLGTQLYLYHWGTDRSTTSDDEEDPLFGFTDSLLSTRPEIARGDATLGGSWTKAGRLQEHLEEGGGSFQGSKVVDRTGLYPIRGYNPNIFDEEEVDSDDDDEESDGDGDDSDKEDEDIASDHLRDSRTEGT